MVHTHSHTPAGRNRRRLAIVFALTASYMVAEIIGGLLTGRPRLSCRFQAHADGCRGTGAVASHDDVLHAVKECVTSNFKIAHAAMQVERKGCAQWETHI